MAINAEIEEKEAGLIQELRIAIKPHNLTLIALAKLYQIDELFVFDINGEVSDGQGEAVANQFVMNVGSGIQNIVDHNGGLTRETVASSKELIHSEYKNALECFINVIENARSNYKQVTESELQGYNLETHDIPESYWGNFDYKGTKNLINLLHIFLHGIDEGFHPHDIMGDS